MPASPTDTPTLDQTAAASQHPPIQDWDRLVSGLLPVLAETASIRLGQEIELEYAGTESTSQFHPSGPGLFISLSVGGEYSGSVHIPLDSSLAHNLAQASFGQPDPPEVDETQPLDETRAQAVEDLAAVLAQSAVDQISQEHSVQLELAVSDRDYLPGPEKERPAPAFLAAPAWQVTVDASIDHTHVGRILVLVPHSLFQSDDMDFEDEDQDDGYNIDPEEMAALVRPSQSDEEQDADREAEDADPGDGEAPAQEEPPSQEETAVMQADGDTDDTAQEIDHEQEATEQAPAQTEQSAPAAEEAAQEKTESTVDIHALHTTLLQASYQVEEELGSFLGEPFEIYDYLSRVISKKDFLHQFQNKVVVTNLAVSGDHYGTAFAVLSLADAITLGGKLIMLPPEEISRKITSGQLKEDEEDAYGEVINILTGAYSHAFGEYFPHKLRLKKDRMTTAAPTKVDITSEEPFPDGEYFLATYQMRLGSQNLEQMSILLPPQLVSLSMQDVEALKKHSSSGAGGQDQSGTGTIFIPGQEGGGKPAIAVISDDSQQGQVVATSLEDEGVELIQLKLRDKMREKLKSYNVLGAFLVLKSIDENTVATLIKVRSVLKGRCPLIIGGPKWTRSKVIQAIRYGAQDILTTPPDPAQIVDKAHKHMFASTAQ